MAAPLTKATVARRQLATAIELYFDSKCLVSVYSLASNAWKVIDALCARAGVDSMSNEARLYLPVGKDLKRDYVNSPHRNFFKHADNDPDEVIEPLVRAHVEGLIFLAVDDYLRLHQRSPMQFQVFQAWFTAKHPEKVSAEFSAEKLESIERLFPNLGSLPYEEQLSLAGAVLKRAMTEPELMADPRTERAFD